MATRSTISYVNENGNVTGVYCHWDGFVDHNGVKLVKHYNTLDRVKALVALGGLSVLDDSIECPEGHTFEHRTEGYTLAYHRDRGEELRILQASCIHSFIEKYSEEYNYFFNNGEWYVGHGRKTALLLLKDAIRLDTAESE